jgi:hypothetical protein
MAFICGLRKSGGRVVTVIPEANPPKRSWRIAEPSRFLRQCAGDQPCPANPSSEASPSIKQNARWLSPTRIVENKKEGR